MNNQKMLDVVTMIANVILPDKCDHESAVEIWLRAMKRKAREALEYRERYCSKRCRKRAERARWKAKWKKRGVNKYIGGGSK